MKDNRITGVRLGELRKDVEKEAADRGMCLSEMVREAVKDHLYSDRLPRRDDLFRILTVLHEIKSNTLRVGINFNQLMRFLHDQRTLDAERIRNETNQAYEVFSQAVNDLKALERITSGI